MHLQERKIRELHDVSVENWRAMSYYLETIIWDKKLCLVWNRDMMKRFMPGNDEMRAIFDSLKNIKVPVYVLRPENYPPAG